VDVEEAGARALDAAFKVHAALGPGMLEPVYGAAMEIEFRRQGVTIERQKPIQATYEGQPLGIGFRADIIVEGLVLLELKAVDAISSAHKKMMTTYLRLIPLQLGFLINFNAEPLKHGIVRVVNGLTEEKSGPGRVTMKGGELLYRRLGRQP
jgi:GxxExxY protein